MDTVWGAIRAVGFLIILGATIVEYPNVFTLIFRYLDSWGTYGHPVLPPHALGLVIIFLLTAGGIWGLMSSGPRLVFTHHIRKPLRDIVGALLSLYIAFILGEFYAHTVGGAVLVLLFFVGLAGVVLANALITFMVPRGMTMAAQV